MIICTGGRGDVLQYKDRTFLWKKELYRLQKILRNFPTSRGILVLPAPLRLVIADVVLPLYQSREKVLFNLVGVDLHLFQHALSRSHHVRGAGQIKGALLIVGNQFANHAVIDSACEVTPVVGNRLGIGQRVEDADTGQRLRLRQAACLLFPPTRLLRHV